MTSYGSYNNKRKPMIKDSFVIAIINSVISFFCGFVVFGVLGYEA